MIDLDREEFEKLPSIKVFLPSFEFNEEINEYVRSGLYHQPEYSLGFFNGAWYAFQEQQKKLDCCREENKAHLEKIDEAITRCKFLKTNGGDRRTLEDIELILKGNKDEN